MDINTLRDSVETSVSMKLFKSFKDSLYYHIYKSELITLPLSSFRNFNIVNFNSNRLNSTTPEEAYPPSNKPRGKNDISSVKYYMHHKIIPIWIIKIKNKFTLLDGAHRIVAAHLIHNKNIDVYLITK